MARRVVLTIFFLIFVALLGFRAESCGSDTDRYLLRFNYMANVEWSSVFSQTLFENDELGFSFFTKLIASITESETVYLMVMAMWSVLPWWYFTAKESDNAILSIALFVGVAPFAMFFSGMRQIMAMAFAIPMWYCTKKKKWLLFILLGLFAMLFHSSAFMLFFIYPLYYLTINKRSLFFVVPAAVLVLVFNKPIFQFLSTFYADGVYEVVETDAYSILILLAIFVVYCYFIPDEKRMDRDTIAMRNILVLSLFIQCFAPVHTLSMRMNYYFLPFIPVLITRVAYRSRDIFKHVTQISAIVMTVYFIYYFISMGVSGTGPLHIFPYASSLS